MDSFARVSPAVAVALLDLRVRGSRDSFARVSPAVPVGLLDLRVRGPRVAMLCATLA